MGQRFQLGRALQADKTPWIFSLLSSILNVLQVILKVHIFLRWKVSRETLRHRLIILRSLLPESSRWGCFLTHIFDLGCVFERRRGDKFWIEKGVGCFQIQTFIFFLLGHRKLLIIFDILWLLRSYGKCTCVARNLKFHALYFEIFLKLWNFWILRFESFLQ